MPAAPVAGDNAADSERGGPSGFSSAGTAPGPGPPAQLRTGGMKGTGVCYWSWRVGEEADGTGPWWL